MQLSKFRLCETAEQTFLLLYEKLQGREKRAHSLKETQDIKRESTEMYGPHLALDLNKL